MAKKTFNLDNPAMQFISTPEENKPETHTIAPAPEGYKINPLYVEKKSRRLQLLIQPTLYEKLKEKAKADGVSVNETIHCILSEAMRGE